MQPALHTGAIEMKESEADYERIAFTEDDCAFHDVPNSRILPGHWYVFSRYGLQYSRRRSRQMLSRACPLRKTPSERSKPARRPDVRQRRCTYRRVRLSLWTA